MRKEKNQFVTGCVFFMLLIADMGGPAATTHAEVDMVQLPTTVYVCDCSPSCNPCEYAYDGDFDTCYGSGNYANDAGITATTLFEAWFDEPCRLSRITYRLYAHCGCFSHYDRGRAYELYVQYRQNNTWCDVPGSHYSGSWGDEGHSSLDTGIVDYSADQDDVTAIRAYVYSWGWGTGGIHGHAYTDSWIYELHGWGNLPSPTPAATPTMAATDSPIPTSSPTSIPTLTPTDTPTNTPTHTPTLPNTVTHTRTPSPTPTDTPTMTPTDTYTPSFTPTIPPISPTISPTPNETAIPTATPGSPIYNPPVPIPFWQAGYGVETFWAIHNSRTSLHNLEGTLILQDESGTAVLETTDFSVPPGHMLDLDTIQEWYHLHTPVLGVGLLVSTFGSTPDCSEDAAFFWSAAYSDRPTGQSGFTVELDSPIRPDCAMTSKSTTFTRIVPFWQEDAKVHSFLSIRNHPFASQSCSVNMVFYNQNGGELGDVTFSLAPGAANFIETRRLWFDPEGLGTAVITADYQQPCAADDTILSWAAAYSVLGGGQAGFMIPCIPY